MKRVIASVFLTVQLVVLPVAADICVVLDVDAVGSAEISNLKNLRFAGWSVENGRQLMVCGSGGLYQELRRRGYDAKKLYSGVEPSRVFALQTDRDFDEFDGISRILLRRPWLAIVELVDDQEFSSPELLHNLDRHEVLAYQVANRRQKRARAPDPGIQALVDQVDEDLWFSVLGNLASFNRFSYNDGIYQAESWLVSYLSALPGMTVTTPAFLMGGREVHNVVGTLTGTTRPDDWVIVGGHYDSTSQDTSIAAPGAEDNASGCAGVMEIARIFAANPPAATMVFICYVGEEQGLLGSGVHAANLDASGDADKVDAVLTMDMIGYTEDADLDCLLETKSFAQPLLTTLEQAAADYTDLRIESSLYAFGSDHVSYLNEGIPAMLSIENDWASYPDYHKLTDLPANITLAMGREIVKLNVAAAAIYGSDAEVRIFADGFENANLESWSSVTNP